MTRFSDSELIDLIDEVGDYIELGIREQTFPGDAARGLPPGYHYVSRRRIKAYITQMDTSISLPGGVTKFGLLQAYILGSSVDLSEFTNQALILYQDSAYHIEYQDDIRSQGRLALHKVQLIPSETYMKVESLDGVVRLPEPQPNPAELIPPVGSPEAHPEPFVLVPAPTPFAPM